MEGRVAQPGFIHLFPAFSAAALPFHSRSSQQAKLKRGWLKWKIDFWSVLGACVVSLIGTAEYLAVFIFIATLPYLTGLLTDLQTENGGIEVLSGLQKFMQEACDCAGGRN